MTINFWGALSHDIKLPEHLEQKDLNYFQAGSRDKYYRKNTSNLYPRHSKLNKNLAKNQDLVLRNLKV